MQIKNPHFYPVHARSPVVDEFQEIVQSELINLDCKINLKKADKNKNLNLSKREQTALKFKKNKKTIVTLL